MIQVELEERVERRDYKLPAIFGCYICENNENPNFDFVNIVVDGGILQKCMEGHIHKVHRRCTKCQTNYPLHVDICTPCEFRINQVILHEKMIEYADEKINEIKRTIRKKLMSKEEGEKAIRELQAERILCEGILEELNKPVENSAGIITRIDKKT